MTEFRHGQRVSVPPVETVREQEFETDDGKLVVSWVDSSAQHARYCSTCAGVVVLSTGLEALIDHCVMGGSCPKCGTPLPDPDLIS